MMDIIQLELHIEAWNYPLKLQYYIYLTFL